MRGQDLSVPLVGLTQLERPLKEFNELWTNPSGLLRSRFTGWAPTVVTRVNHVAALLVRERYPNEEEHNPDEMRQYQWQNSPPATLAGTGVLDVYERLPRRVAMYQQARSHALEVRCPNLLSKGAVEAAW